MHGAKDWLSVRLILLIKNLPTVHSLSNLFLPQGNAENEKSFMYQVVEFSCMLALGFEVSPPPILKTDS